MSYDVPSGFRQTDAQHFCHAVVDGTHTSPKESITGRRLITSKHIKSGRVELSSAYRISEADFLEINRRSQVDQWDVIFTMIGTVGESALVVDEDPDFTIKNVGLFKNVDELSGRWLYYFLRTPEARAELDHRKKGSTQQYISLGDLRSFPLLVPIDSDTTAAIVSILQSLDDRINLLRQTNTTLEAIAQALFKSWFVDFDPVRAKAEGREPEAMDDATADLFPSEFEQSELGLIPKGWRVVPLLEACDLQGGSQPPAKTFIDEPRDGYVRLLQIRDFTNEAHLTFVPASKNLKTVQDDDILIGRYGSASGDKKKDSLGRICRGLDGAYNVALMKLCPIMVGREFALRWFDDPRFYNYLQGVSAKAVQSGFSKSELSLYLVAIPDQPLMVHYESIGSAIWQTLKLGRQRMEVLKTLRDTLLPRLISGKLRLPEAEAVIEDAVA